MNTMKTAQTTFEGATLSEFVAHLLDEPNSPKWSAIKVSYPLDLNLVEALKREVDTFKTSDVDKAFLASRYAYEVSQLAEEPDAKALGLWAYALGLTLQGQFREALRYFERAYTSYQSLAKPADAARVGMRYIQALAMTGKYEDALKLADDVYKTFEKCELKQEAFTALNNKGIIYLRTGQFAKAREVFKRVLSGFEVLGDKSGRLLAHINLGNVYQEQDDFQKAEVQFNDALELATDLSQQKHIAGTLVNLALLYRRRGRKTEALKLLSRVHLLYEELSAGTDAAFAKLEEARIHLDLNLFAEAVTLATELLDGFRTKEMLSEEAEVLQVLGVAQAKLGQVELALSTLWQARRAWQALGNEVQVAYTELYLSGLSLELSQRDEALKLAKSAATLFVSRGLAVGRAQAYIALARALWAKGFKDEALAVASDAMSEVKSLGITTLSFQASYLMGQLALAEQQASRAEVHLLEAVSYLEQDRASLPDVHFKTAYLSDKLEVYSDLMMLYSVQHRIEDMYHTAQKAKARALLEHLSQQERMQGSSEETQLHTRLREARERLTWHTATLEDKGYSADTKQKIHESEELIEKLGHDLKRLSPGTLPFMTVPSLQDLQAKLTPTTILIQYFKLNNQFAAFIVGSTSIRVVYELASEKAICEDLAWLEFYFSRFALGKAYLEAYGSERLDELCHQHLSRLYSKLVHSLKIDSDIKELIIVPHDSLHRIPFSALHDGEQYLCDRFELSLVPSSAVYLYSLASKQPRQTAVCAFGVSDNRLAHVRHEMAAITEQVASAQVFLDEKATRENFYQHAPDADVLHIASHGVFRRDNPMFSGLRLRNGWLYAHDLYNLRLSASLVILSACETGLSLQAPGDEGLGLAIAFLEAGVPALVSTLWAVKDEQTAKLIKSLYTHLQNGYSAADALRRAQKDLRLAHPNPYYWAAFNLMGNPAVTLVN